ncbi:uncharacterized protein [Hyperolius riggenbachi]|uniref:uncharacterized protein isoform X2 n=1 Tax=Hyperolius riggenbachi TaxID=752182 RepID=UPI0035A2D50A
MAGPVAGAAVGPVAVSNPFFYPVQARTTAVDTFQDLVESELVQLQKTSRASPNLTKREHDALQSLQNNDSIVIRNADKGGAVVVLDSEMYRAEALRQLDDKETYQILPGDPTARFQVELKKLLNLGVSLGVFSEKERDYLMVETPIVPIFHHLPKVHKPDVPPRGRPIVAGIGSLGERLGQWVDSCLQPLVRRLPGFLRDTTHLLNSLESLEWSNHYTWVTMDVTALYSSIPHGLALKALDFHIQKYGSYPAGVKDLLMLAVDHLLAHNYFLFDVVFFISRGAELRWEKNSPHPWRICSWDGGRSSASLER